MPAIDAVVESPVVDSFRVQQLAGMFDLPPAEKSTRRFHADIPDVDGEWTIGAIVGPSGSGKSTVARRAFSTAVYPPSDWPADAAVVDGFADDLSIREITAALTAVGFSSPPAWLRPYPVLSNGERFRADLARALLTRGELVVYDEFTSVVDRTVAQIGSMAVAKAVRRGRARLRRFVAVTCHYDILDWLQPDWTLDMANCQLARGCLQPRPPIRLEIARCKHGVWRMFVHHHYLTGTLHPGARCYLATWEGRPVSFLATLHSPGRRGRRRITRLVTLPDFQGVGIGTAVLDAVAGLERAVGHRVSITTGHPGMIHALQSRPTWRTLRVSKRANRHRGLEAADKCSHATSRGRMTVSFEFRGVA